MLSATRSKNEASVSLPSSPPNKPLLGMITTNDIMFPQIVIMTSEEREKGKIQAFFSGHSRP